MMSLTVGEEFKPGTYSTSPDRSLTSWQAPSNIALVKYWGKHEGQIPANASLSFTLSNCVTKTEVEFIKKTGQELVHSFEFYFHGEIQESFHPKLTTFFERSAPYLPFLTDYHLIIRSENSFPHSSGIASSASAMAALALCLVDFEQELDPESDVDFNNKASFIARLGSGSASRSILGPVVHWGEHPNLPGASNLYANTYNGPMDPVYNSFKDVILIVEKGVKSVSSTVGHGLMEEHPYARQRYNQAADNLSKLQTVLANGDLKAFASLVELEALSLHAMMMSGSPSYILMKPNTLEIISRVQKFRKDSGQPLCFTLDAGANVHLLFPAGIEEGVMQFIKNELIAFCENQMYICDQVGSGATKVR